MGFGMFAPQHAPIAIDFGSSSVKLMQLDRENPPNLVAAAELVIPESLRTQPVAALQHVGAELPSLLRSAGFKGKKVVTTIPSGLTFTQHMQIAEVDGVKLDDIVKGQLQMQMNCTPQSLVVRCLTVPEAKCRDQSRQEVICFAARRNSIMQYVQLLNNSKLEVSGMHTEALSTITAFAPDHRDGAEANLPRMFINLGWSGTVVTISHGSKLVFARHIQVGGHHFDQQIVKKLKCELHEAAIHRQTLDSPLSREGDVPTEAVGSETFDADGNSDGGVQADPESVATVTDRRLTSRGSDLIPIPASAEATSIIERFDFSELIDMLCDEISMCQRYHRGLFPNMPVDHALLVGGEARQAWLTRTIADQLREDAFVGDPLHRFCGKGTNFTPGLNLDDPRPGWTVACGLSFASSDE